MKEQIEQILATACSACQNAVSHVGAANYQEREADAHMWVNAAIAKAQREIYRLIKNTSLE